MYAVIMTGGKQYRVQAGQTLKVEQLPAAEGAALEINEVLLIADGDQFNVGKPYVEGGKVMAVVKAHGRGPKIKIVKFRRRKHYRKQMGHRQNYTELLITDIGTVQPALTEEISNGT